MLVLGPVAFAWPALAAAQAPVHPIAIAPKAYSEALIDLALQTNISLLGVDQCRGRSVGLAGRYTVRQALERLLDGAPCRFEIVDAKTVRVVAAAVLRSPAPQQIIRPQQQMRISSEAPSAMSEIVVTATKRRLSLGATPAAVSVISGTRLRENGNRHTWGIAGQVAGVVVTNLGPGRDKILLRGLSDGAFTGRTRSTVGTYLDDVPITYNAPDPDLRLTDVERIEVVRGPQGALYGGGSMTGVFRIVTRTPDLERFSGEVDAGIAATASGSRSTSWDGMINIPLAPEKAGVRLVAYRAVDGGYVDDVNLRLSDVDRTLRNGGRAAVELRPGGDWTLTANAAVQHLESNDTQYTTMNRFQRANRVRETHKNNFSEVGLSVSHDGDGARLQSSTAYVRHDYSSLYDASAALSLFDSGEADLGVFREAARINMLVQDLFIASTGAPGRFDWLVGAFGSRTVEKTPSMLRAAGGPPGLPPMPVYAEERSDRLSEVAVYGELSYRFASRWTASAGARVFQTRLRTASEVVVPPPGVRRNFDDAKRFEGVSPKLSIRYDLGGGQLIYALASQGYRAGGFNTAGRSAPAPMRRTYAPDRLENYEIGARLSRFGGRLDLRTAAFYARWTDIQTDQYFSSGLSYTANVGNGRNVGLET